MSFTDFSPKVQKQRRRDFRRDLEAFQKDADQCDLREPSRRIEEPDFFGRRCGPWLFDFFSEMVDNMSEAERMQKFPALADLFKLLLRKPGSKYRLIPITFQILIRTARCIGCPFLFITSCKEALNIEPERFMDILPSEAMGIVLGCFSSRRFNGWGVREGRILMEDMLLRETRSAVLIKYGFSYRFDNHYFFHREGQLVSGDPLTVKGKSLQNEIRHFSSDPLLDFDSLRMQLAMDVLLAVFRTDSNDMGDLLSLLWKAVPFPFVSSAEMSALLSPFFKGEHLQLEELIQEYEKCNGIFEVPQVTEPRSLKHLSRVAVRKALTDACTIGDEAIESLDCPWILKNYLKLDSF